jgi:hypothetical protein
MLSLQILAGRKTKSHPCPPEACRGILIQEALEWGPDVICKIGDVSPPRCREARQIGANSFTGSWCKMGDWKHGQFVTVDFGSENMGVEATVDFS